MTTNNAEALRAATEAVRLVREAEADQRQYGTYGGVEEAQQFAFNMLARHGDTFLAALASQPQAAGVGGDALIERAMQAARSAAPVKADLIMEGISRDRFRAWIAAAVNETLAATPAPAVEREAAADAARLLRWLRSEYISEPEASHEIDRVCAALGFPDEPHEESPLVCETCLRAIPTPPSEAREPSRKEDAP